MKLLIVTPYFYPKIGGLENYAYNISLGLKKKYKWDVVVITSNHKEKKYKEEKINGMKIYRLPYWFKISNTPINPLWYFQIKKIIKQEKPNVINAHTPVPFIADIAAFAVKDIPFFTTYHALTLYKQGFSPLNGIIKAYKLFEYKLFSRSEKILIVSEVIKKSIPNRYKNKITVINNSLPLNKIPAKRNKKNKKNTNIVFISNLDKSHSWKGLKEIIAGVEIYLNKYEKNIHLYVIGEGNYKGHYINLANKLKISNYITFCGKKEGKEKQQILNKTDIGIIYPISSNDAFPTVILEYWAQSLSILAANNTPINKILKNKKTAYLIKPNNSELLANAINKLISNAKLSKSIASEGYKELVSKYVLENEVEKFNLLMRGVL